MAQTVRIATKKNKTDKSDNKRVVLVKKQRRKGNNMAKYKKWFIAAGIRAIKTVAQTAVATIGVSATMGQVNWVVVGSTALLSGILSMLTSLSGLPELK